MSYKNETNKEYHRRYFLEHPEQFREYGRKTRAENQERETKRVKKWREDNPKKQKKIQDKYSKKYIMKNPKIINAHKLSQHIKIPKGYKCIDCKIKLAKEKHHEDYNKPLKVKFLCRKCHKAITPKPIKTEEERR